MATAFSRSTTEAWLDVWEDDDGTVMLSLSTPEGEGRIDVEAEDLARALFTASPTFTQGVSEFAQRAIVAYIEQSAETTEP